MELEDISVFIVDFLFEIYCKWELGKGNWEMERNKILFVQFPIPV
jgi:hypothetical protein